MTTTKTMVGWQEWCSFDELNLPAIKAKVDTGAQTSALHAFDIEEENGMISFKIHPIQGNSDFVVACRAPMADQRSVTSSNGEREKRYVIKTKMKMGDVVVFPEITLTSRHKMKYRMLLGREAMKKGNFTVDPAKSFLLGQYEDMDTLYGLKLKAVG